MTSRVLTAAFRPATALVARLRYAQKFVVVGIVLLVPLGFVTAAYVDPQHAQVALSAEERAGVAVLSPLVSLVADAAQARHAAVCRTTGRQGCAMPDLTRDVAAVDAAMTRRGARWGATDAWGEARGLLRVAGQTVGSAYPAYNLAIDALLDLVVRVGDASNLTLDPNLDTFYLVDTLQLRLPALFDAAGRAVDGAVLAAATGDDGAAAIEVGLDNGVLASTRVTVRRAVTTIVDHTDDGTVRRGTPALFADLDPALEVLTGTLSGALATRQVPGIPVDAADAVHARAVAFATGAARYLDELLATRIDRLTARAVRVELVAGGAAVLSGYLFVGFYLGVVPPIRRIVVGLRAVADGDLTRQVSVDTHDELSFVVRTLNDTVARTKVASDRLALAATHDPLTALPNRALALDRLDEALRTRSGGRRTGVFFIDLDQFKMVNDSLGHEAGDQVLRAVAGRLTALVRDEDTVARLSGDEFVLISAGLAGVEDALRIAERLVAAINEPITVRVGGTERELAVGASVGVAFADGAAAVSGDALLRDADVAMYQAKQRGRGRVEVFDDALRVALERRLRTRNELRRAIEADELVLFYQPVVTTGTGAVIGFEALVRWQHPERGLLGPGEFIDIAEESGLIVPLGAAVLRKACAQLARWRAADPGADLSMSVNVSAAQFSHPSLVPTVASVLAATGVPAAALCLEITETSLMVDADAAEDTLRAIRSLGVHLAIDDFGTGYSSLTYLRRFPVDALKVDRSFVNGLGRDKEDEAIVRLVLNLARTLDLLVVAEGVETAGQLAHLQRLGCPVVQGYLFGRPVPPEEAWPQRGPHSRPDPAPACELDVTSTA